MIVDHVLFPTGVSYGAQGGPEFRTEVVELASGYEQRNRVWAHPRHVYNVGYGIGSTDILEDVSAFFIARGGRARGFLFKDWLDHKSTYTSREAASSDQAIGVGDGVRTQFQTVKTYSSGTENYVRVIQKIVAGTMLVEVDGVLQESGWSVDETTGVITFNAAPSAGVVIRAGFEFHVPVRFDADSLSGVLQSFQLGDVPAVNLRELRLPVPELV